MKKPPFEDVSPIKTGGIFQPAMLILPTGYIFENPIGSGKGLRCPFRPKNQNNGMGEF